MNFASDLSVSIPVYALQAWVCSGIMGDVGVFARNIS